MQNLEDDEWLTSFACFEEAAAKGHEESIWIMSVAKDLEMTQRAFIEAFTRTEEPLGWFIAGKLPALGRKQFELFKKSAEGGCSWGQAAYGWCFKIGRYVEEDEEVYVEWLKKAANQSHPSRSALHDLGNWYKDEFKSEEAYLCFRRASELGNKQSMLLLAEMLRDGKGCAKDLRQAAIWSAQEKFLMTFRIVLGVARAAAKHYNLDLDCDFNQLCYSLGWGMYWYVPGENHFNAELKVFGNRCLDYYCSCVELQQKSIFTFLWFWNQTAGVKDIGGIIGKMVWEQREAYLLKSMRRRTC
jgi:hypothetical protein